MENGKQMGLPEFFKKNGEFNTELDSPGVLL